MPKVSVVIPAYNVERYLGQCLESVANQTLTDIEIIVVDDGSTDSSGDIADGFAQRDPRFQVIHKPNTGYGNSMNIGFAAAKGEYVGIVESDDWADDDMFEKLYAAAVENRADVVKSNHYEYFSLLEECNTFFETVSYKLCGKVFAPSTDLKGMRMVEFWNMQPSIWSAIYRRAFVQENGILFNETPGASYQDTGFTFKVWTCAERVFCLYAAYLHYRQDNENSSVNNPNKVYCVRDEYEEIKRFIALEPEGRGHLIPIMNRIRFDSYLWNYNRIDDSFKLEFIKYMADEFREAGAQKGLRSNLFERHKWDELKKIVTDPEEYHRRRDLLKKGEEALSEDIVGSKVLNELRSINRQTAAMQMQLDNIKPYNGFILFVLRKMRTAVRVLRAEGITGIKEVLREKLR